MLRHDLNPFIDKFVNEIAEDLSDVTDDVWLANRTSFHVRSLQNEMEVRLTVANQNQAQIHTIVYKQKTLL